MTAPAAARTLRQAHRTPVARTLAPLMVAATLLAVAAPAHAHATAFTPGGELKFTYGNIGEPVYTFQKTGLDLGITDANNTPVEGLTGGEGEAPGAKGFRLWLVHAGSELELTEGLRSQFGRPGWYTYPYVLTEPGAYSLRIEGTIDGVAVDQTVAPRHEITAMADIMWPTKYAGPDDLETRVEALEAQMSAHADDGEGRDAAAPVGAFAVVALALAVALRRLTHG